MDGAKMVARAWVDPQFKKLLLENPKAAVQALGIDVKDFDLVVLENTDNVHNLVVCTLCSCYPKPLLGRPPAWYKSRNYRARAIYQPRQVLKEFGTVIPDSVAVQVHDSTADMRYLVLPLRPRGTEKWDEQALKDVVTRDSMIGVTVLPPVTTTV